MYLGNVATDGGTDTVCKGCGETVVNRSGYRIDASGLDEAGCCAACGAKNNIVAGPKPVKNPVRK